MPDLCPQAHALLERWKNEDPDNRTYQVAIVKPAGTNVVECSIKLTIEQATHATTVYLDEDTNIQLQTTAYVIDQSRRAQHMASYKPMDINFDTLTEEQA